MKLSNLQVHNEIVHYKNNVANDRVHIVRGVYRKSLGSATRPVSADAAAVYGDARYTCPSLCPIRPGKFLQQEAYNFCCPSP